MIAGETGAPAENPHRRGENMQTPHEKALLIQELNPGPSSSCKMTVSPMDMKLTYETAPDLNIFNKAICYIIVSHLIMSLIYLL